MQQNSEPQTDFHRLHNVSYIDPKLPRSTFKQAMRHYIASALIYGSVLFLFSVSPWFRDLLGIMFRGYPLQVLYCYAYVAYLLIAPLVFFVGRPQSLWVSKNLRIAGYIGRLARWCLLTSKQRTLNDWHPTYEEKHAMMFLLVKIFYGPLMVNSALMGYNEILRLIYQVKTPQSLLYYCDKAYLVLVAVIFLIDSITFSVGYHTESHLLRNKLRFVETNPLRILVCIICYPPFNMITSALFGPSNHDIRILFCGNLAHPLTWILRGLAVLFLILLIAASLSLFTKASNLTNRGIVDWGPYRFIRHPGYLAKNMFWLMTLLPAFIPNTNDPRFTWPRFLLFCTMTVWGFITWGTIYFLRSITEEKFLARDPDYVAYCKKVKYRFIPGVY